MKRVLFTFLLFFLPFVFVCAEDSNQEKKYRFYYLEREYSDSFFKKDEEVDDYPYLTDIFIYDSKINESFDEVDEDSRIIEEIPVISYQEEEKVKYVRINNFISDRKINLEEIDVLAYGKQIRYKVDCPTCSSDFLTRVNNDKYGFEKNYLSGNEDILLILDEEYFPKDLEILLALGSSDNIKASYTVTVNNTSLKSDKYYYYQREEASNYTIESRVKLKDLDHDERYSSEIKTIENITSVDNAKVVSKKIKYLYQNKLYLRYRENRVYVDGYHTNIKGLIKDEDNYVIIDKDLVTPTISEYIEKEVIVDVKEKEVPKYQEVVRYLSNSNSNTQQEKEEVKITKQEDESLQVGNKDNYLIKYISYFVLGVFLMKKVKFPFMKYLTSFVE